LANVQKYSLDIKNGREVQLPAKPEAAGCAKPTECAPMRATVSWSFSPAALNLARILYGAKIVPFGCVVGSPPPNRLVLNGDIWSLGTYSAPFEEVGSPSVMGSGRRTLLAATLNEQDVLSTLPARQVTVGPAISCTATTPARVYTSARLALNEAATELKYAETAARPAFAPCV
jgi:hypothetical protein